MNRILLFLISIISLTGCSNSEGIGLIKNHSWTIVSAIASKPVDLNNRGTSSIDVWSQGSACGSDDIFSFKEGDSLILDNGEIACDLPKTMNGKWRILSGDSLIIDHPLGRTLRFKILSIRQHEMLLRTQLDFLPPGIDIVYTFRRKD